MQQLSMFSRGRSDHRHRTASVPSGTVITTHHDATIGRQRQAGLRWRDRPQDTASRLTRRAVVGGWVVACLASSSALAVAQDSFTTISVTSTGERAGARSVTANEAFFHVLRKRMEVESRVSFRDAHYPIDSMLANVATTAGGWLDRVRQHPPAGIQLEAAGGMGGRARHLADAKTQFAAALAARNLSVADRGYTLAFAVATFADWRYPDDLPTAENYLKDLIALGAPAASWQYRARQTLLDAYYSLGRSADVIRHGTAATALLAKMSYIDQAYFVDFVPVGYMKLVNALTGQPDARAKIEAINAALLATIEPSPGLVAIDSAYWDQRNSRKASIEGAIMRGSLLGTVGKPWVAHYWVNRATNDSADVAVNDGKIRLVEDFGYACEGCVMALHSLERLKQQFPDIEAMGITVTFGAWANRIVTPEVEAKHLDDFFRNKIKVTVPIGIWKSPRVVGDDEGLGVELGTGPNVTNYPPCAKSCTWLIDGHGRIRRIFEVFDRDTEAEVARTIEFLRREAATEAAAKASAASQPGAGRGALATATGIMTKTTTKTLTETAR
jgi:hypothetical protein